MDTRSIRRFVGGALLTLLAASPLFAVAQDYPHKPIKLIIPFPPGGPTDVFGRLYAQRLAEVLRQPVVSENRAGAGSAIGVNSVAKSEPDGYTVLFGTGSIATAAALTKLPYDPKKDIEPVAHVGTVPLVLLSAPNMPKGVDGVLAALRAAPGKYSYGSAGQGTTTHLAAEMLKLKANV
ncbi:MAG: tripartite tricarboxylate transporter substrate-binding protein, partial [Burkholderiaceae bacterium]|nr:tripartite tricarboxylate transporter substrate-binding protein [Burkholderiaceae bacterium]